MKKQGQKGQEKKPEQPCVHNWQYNTKTKQHECTKCGIPAPPDWNDVPF